MDGLNRRPKGASLLIRGSVVGSALSLSVLVPLTAYAASPDGGGVGHCVGSLSDICVIAEDPGDPGSASDSASDTKPSGDESAKPVCEATLMEPQPPASSDLWEGHKPGDGAVYVRACLTGGNSAIDIFWAANSPAGNAVNPEVLAQQAVDKMKLSGPDIASPRAAGKYIVGVPMWMWANKSPTTYGPNTASATAGGVAVTATANVTQIVWKMGDGTTVTCNGAGTPYKASYGKQESPSCGHTYILTSASQSGGKYAVTATSTWTVNWQVNGGGATGQLTEIRQSQAQVAIGELQVVG